MNRKRHKLEEIISKLRQVECRAPQRRYLLFFAGDRDLNRKLAQVLQHAKDILFTVVSVSSSRSFKLTTN
jgi:hypothetical protein